VPREVADGQVACIGGRSAEAVRELLQTAWREIPLAQVVLAELAGTTRPTLNPAVREKERRGGRSPPAGAA